jgi:hypothetical protein
MAAVLKNRGVKNISAIDDSDLFAAVEQSRAAMGMPTAYMLAKIAADKGEQVNADDFADQPPPSVRAKVNEMAVAFYAKADNGEAEGDVELVVRPAVGGDPGKIDPKAIYDRYNAPKANAQTT